jgi:hypothetical protein
MRARAIIMTMGMAVAASLAAQTAIAQTTSPPVTPHVFDKDLRTLPPAPPVAIEGLPRRTVPGPQQPYVPRPPSGPDPLRQK